MPQPPGAPGGRHVILPWAPYQRPADPAAAAPDPARRQREEGLRIAGDGLAIGTRPEAGLTLQGPADGRAPRRLLEPPLRAAGLPMEPMPTVPAEDRGALDPEDLVSLAVSLDVLASATREISAGPTVLQQFCQALLYVARLGGAEDATLTGLMEFAVGSGGLLREAHAQGDDRPLPPPPSTPQGVAASLRDIEATATLLVREATLLLDAREPLDTWQG